MNKTKPIEKIRRDGFRALREQLGPVETARFLQSLGAGSGNYTEERKEWLPDDMQEAKKLMEEFKNKEENG